VRRRGAEEIPDIDWFSPEGAVMTEEDWGSGFGKSVALFLNGLGIPDLDSRGQRVVDDSFMLFFNAHYDEIEFFLPGADHGSVWEPVLDTARGTDGAEPIKAGAAVPVAGRSLVVLRNIE
jgi:glycogen operon protein